MKIFILSITTSLYCFSFFFQNNYFSPEKSPPNNYDIDESSFYYVLDNRYQGGSDAFIDLFKEHVSYPEEAFNNCRVGLSKVYLRISQEGTLTSYEFTAKLGMGIEDKLVKFFEATRDQWKAWARGSELEMTVGFSLITQRDSYYPDADLLVLEKSAFKWATDNEYCDPDAKILKRIKKFIKRKKFVKAESYLKEMIRRYPDNSEFKDQLKSIQNNLK